MTNQNKLIPELRFPEFKNEGEWDVLKAGEISEIVIGGTPSTTVAEYWGGDIGWIGSGELKNGIIKSPTKYITKLGLEKSSTHLLPKGTPVLAMTGATLGKIGLLDIECCGNQSVAGFVKLKNLDSVFLYHQLQKITNQIISFAGGGAQTGINKSNIENLKLLVPKLKEQLKIASCLSSLDEVIAAHSQKLELLKDHKKGLMQNLFPQEGEKVPKVRFKEFEKDGEWVLKPFSKYIKLYRGSSPRPIIEYQTQDLDGVNWIKIGDTGSVTDFVIRSVSEKITPKGAEKSRAVKKGELILANSMSYGSTYHLDIDGCIYDGWFVLREYEEVFDKQFLLQILNSEYMQNQYKKLAAGGIVQNISSEIVYSTLLPKTSKSEQQKIASCLSSLDAIITAQAERIEQLKLHKKGLMLGLFPKMND